jgi:hypothetical protein
MVSLIKLCVWEFTEYEPGWPEIGMDVGTKGEMCAPLGMKPIAWSYVPRVLILLVQVTILITDNTEVFPRNVKIQILMLS